MNKLTRERPLSFAPIRKRNGVQLYRLDESWLVVWRMDPEWHMAESFPTKDLAMAYFDKKADEFADTVTTSSMGQSNGQR